MTNKEMTEQPLFKRLCELAGIKATKRQASKWQNGRGRARTKWERLSQSEKMETALEFKKKQEAHDDA